MSFKLGHFIKTNSSFPMQYEGKYKKNIYFIRYRYGYLEITLGTHKYFNNTDQLLDAKFNCDKRVFFYEKNC